jgi:hypothetical protein
VERKTTEVKQEAEQLNEVEQLAYFSLRLVKGGFFDVETNYLNTHVIPTKAQSKYMMRHKGKE